ncbi:metallophosphoesterase [Frigidibacter sp. SD6-1]|uniref:metallophosphoesterase family protein n=1 Tax=Frigidibacter sp. SD6-1 TaxID=3032581 RepID=UPI0024DFA2BF|nr:metallophosphoesterase [Frigidibacter sp. SD6-1]
MTCIVHLSDLHFGCIQPSLTEPLIEAVNAAGAHAVAVSGDLTQRARTSQFRAARAFLDRIEAPVVVVPGNHDVPLFNPFLRLARPFARYRRWIDDRLESVHDLPGAVLVGLNTVDPWRHQRGRIGEGGLALACAAFAGGPSDRWKIVVAHHPFDQAPGSRKKLMRGAGAAAARLADCGAHLVLSGHLHSWRAEPFVETRGQRRMVQVHAGTGLSRRLRNEPNDFCVMRLDADRLTIDRMAAPPGATRFDRIERFAFRHTSMGWLPGGAT